MFLCLDVFIIAAVYRSINFIIAFCDKNFRNSCFKHTKIVLFCIRAFVLQASLHAAAACFQPLVASSVLLYKQRTSLVDGHPPIPRELSSGQAAHQTGLALPCGCEITAIKKAGRQQPRDCHLPIHHRFFDFGFFSCCRRCSSSIFRNRSMSCFAIW